LLSAKAHIELRAAMDLAGGALEYPSVEFGEEARKVFG
jgi:hypothetical protein